MADPVLPLAPWFHLPEDWEEQHPVLSPNAKPEAHWTALAEAELRPHPGDGGGSAWLEAVESVGPAAGAFRWQRNQSDAPRPVLTRSGHYRFTVVYEAGSFGIQQGGLIFIAPEAFWFWSEAQTESPDLPGWTTATSETQGLTLTALDGSATFVVSGRDLAPRERIEFVYGAGTRGAQIDRYAERGSEIMIAVDADGDGFRRWLPRSAEVDVVAQEVRGLIAHGPAEIEPGAAFEIIVAVVDGVGNRLDQSAAPSAGRAAITPAFRVRNLEASTLGLTQDAARVKPTGSQDERLAIELAPTPGEGVLRLRLEGLDALDGLAFDLPPIVVRDATERLVWGDLHGHSQLSDGTGTPEDYFRYARDVARLDVVALTDHDHWGPRPLDQHPDLARQSMQTGRSWNRPNEFVTIPGYEWTSWLHGHRHVLYFGEDAPIYSAIDPATDRPDELWEALRGQPALTFAHHSAGEPIATNWFYPPDPVLEPLSEIVSVHGMSEAADAPLPILGAIPGYFVRDTLVHGYRLGFIGSGDSHDGHPGLAQLSSGQGGLAGIFTSALDRENLLGALRRRHTFATNGIRPWLEVRIDTVTMGGSLPPGDAGHTLRVRYEGTAPVARIDLIRTGRVATLEVEKTLSYTLTRKIPRLAPGEFHYVRIQQVDGGIAWSSPIFVD